jgi:hypothetical protein
MCKNEKTIFALLGSILGLRNNLVLSRIGMRREEIRHSKTQLLLFLFKKTSFLGYIFMHS